jgi:hypothetical protein
MLASNRAFLQERFPSILAGIRGIKDPLPVEQAKNGLATCRYGGRFMHSPYDPAKEARDTLASLGYAGQPLVLLAGAGLGHGLSALGPAVRVVVLVEKDPAVFEALCRTTDLSACAGKLEALHLLVDPSEHEVAACLDGLDPSLLAGLFVWEHRPVTDSDSTGFYAGLRRTVRTRLDRLLSEINTTGYFAPVWFANTLRNLRLLDGSVDLAAFRNAFSAFPAAVVSAGPTLDETVSLLGPAADCVVIVSAATAVRRLLAEGIVPHFVVSTDAGYYNSWHTRGLDLGDSILVSDLSVSHLVHGSCRTSTACWTRSAWIDFNLGFHDVFTKPGLDLPKFNMAGTVASTSVELARYLGCSRIWLFGQDFGFVAGRSHCKRTIYETYNLGRQDRTATYETLEARSVLTEKTGRDTDHDGRGLLTSVKLKLYKDWFEKNYEGLFQTSRKSARLANADLKDFSAAPLKPGVSGTIRRLCGTVRWVPNPGSAALVSDAGKKLEESESPAEFLDGLDARLSGGMKTFVEFELFRAGRAGNAAAFPPAVREKLRGYLNSLSRFSRARG